MRHPSQLVLGVFPLVLGSDCFQVLSGYLVIYIFFIALAALAFSSLCSRRVSGDLL